MKVEAPPGFEPGVEVLQTQAGTPVHVVSQRLGHAKASMTLDVYAHALPNMQQDAATRLAALLRG